MNAGRLILCGMGGDLSAVEADLRAGRLGGLVLFREDFDSLTGAQAIIRRAREMSPVPLLVCADEEGGLVSQIDGVPLEPGDTRRRGASGPSPGTLGELDDAGRTRAVFAAVGGVLSAVGVDIAFAPLADVDSRPENPVIGSRSFGADPLLVIRHATAALEGLSDAGVHACAKHFPGHGDASSDSHHERPVIDASLETLEARELLPFRALVRDGVPLVMTAHASYPSLDPSGAAATCSRPILDRLLRERMGFGGAIVSDALEMEGFGGAAGTGAIGAALGAGVDLFLVARAPEEAAAVRAALEAVAMDPAGARRIREAGARAAALARPRRVPRAEGGARVARALEAGVSVLEEAHARATRLGRPPGRGESRSWKDAIEPVRLVVCDLAPPTHLDVAGAAAALASWPRARIVRVGPLGAPDVSSLGEDGTAVVVLLVRGSRPDARTQALVEAVETWRAAAETARRVIAIAAADAHVLGAVPPAWGTVRASGTHRSSFEAAFRAIRRACR